MDAEQQSSAENYKKNRFLRLKVIVPVLMVGVTFASCVAVGIGGYLNARSGLKQAAQGELTMVAKARQALVGMRLEGLAGSLSNVSSGAGASLALNDMNSALVNLDNDRASLQEYFQAEGSSAEERAEKTGKKVGGGKAKKPAAKKATAKKKAPAKKKTAAKADG